MKEFFNVYNKAEEYFLVGCLAFTVCIVFLQVVMRNLFNYALPWCEELSRYIFVWLVWLGASMTTRKKGHIRVEFIFNIFGGKYRVFFEILTAVIWCGFCIFLAAISSQLVIKAYNINNVSTAMQLPMYISYLAIPVGVGIMSLRLIGQIIEIIKTMGKTPAKEALE
ncbi:MAG: TRAP transporter small permease [Bacillota bacterium]|nr:TRAP transporter small permease [Bacillota bacterium]